MLGMYFFLFKKEMVISFLNYKIMYIQYRKLGNYKKEKEKNENSLLFDYLEISFGDLQLFMYFFLVFLYYVYNILYWSFFVFINYSVLVLLSF